MTEIGEERKTPAFITRYDHESETAQLLAEVATIGGTYELWMTMQKAQFYVVARINPHPPKVLAILSDGSGKALRIIASLVEADISMA